MAANAEEVLRSVWRFCVDQRWSGWDPYDGLMATHWLARLGLGSRLGRLVLIQGMKRSPLNLRRWLGVPTLRNDKALALGLMAAEQLATLPAWRDEASREARQLATWLLAGAVPTAHGVGWGYPFDWQSRSFFLPRGAPTVVCTGFVVRALDRFRSKLQDTDRLAAPIDAAIDAAAQFVARDLNRSESADGFCFSYSPRDRAEVVNATLLGAETLARAAVRLRRPTLFDDALPTVVWSLARQQTGAGWSYGQAGHHTWEDGFHTGFNLLSLLALRNAAGQLGRQAEQIVTDDRLLATYHYYATRFFDPDGRPWYYRHTPWPIDGHAAAVGILTHLAFAPLDDSAAAAAQRTRDWTLRALWNHAGFFDYQITRRYRTRIPYLRWTQAWMLAALAADATATTRPAAG